MLQIQVPDTVLPWQLMLAQPVLGGRYRKVVSSPQEAYILSLIRQLGQVSRPDISRLTGLSKTAVTARLSSLANLGLIDEAPGGLRGEDDPRGSSSLPRTPAA